MTALASGLVDAGLAAISLPVPAWIDALVAAWREPFDTDEAQMRLCVALSAETAKRGNGGPFGAAVFQGSTLIAAGANQVLASGLSIAHAEIVALLRAQQAVPTMSARPAPVLERAPYRLVTSAEPCCQCFGALVWSGVQELVCGAATSDVEAVGFDEGPKPERWVESLTSRGFRVREGVRRAEAVEVLRAYREGGGPLYGVVPASPRAR